MLLKGSSILPLCIVLLVFLLKKIVRVLTELLKKSLIHKIYGEIIYKLNYIHKVNIVCVYIENIKYFLLVSAIFCFHFNNGAFRKALSEMLSISGLFCYVTQEISLHVKSM